MSEKQFTAVLAVRVVLVITSNRRIPIQGNLGVTPLV